MCVGRLHVSCGWVSCTSIYIIKNYINFNTSSCPPLFSKLFKFCALHQKCVHVLMTLFCRNFFIPLFSTLFLHVFGWSPSSAQLLNQAHNTKNRSLLIICNSRFTKQLDDVSSTNHTSLALSHFHSCINYMSNHRVL